MSSSTSADKEVKKTTEGEALKVDFSSSISSLFPPLFKFLEIFGPDKVLWLGIVFVLHLVYYTTAPRALLFLLPYPLGYLMPMYMTMTALQRVEDAKGRAFWLSYWACLLGVDLVEMVVLGRWAQALLYWPGVKVGLALFLMMETADFTAPPEIDKEMKKRLDSERRHKRRLWTAQALEKYKVRSDVKKIEVQNEEELEKSKKRPRRYHAYMLVSPFLPDKAHAGGTQVYIDTDPPEPKIDKKTGRPVRTMAMQRDEVREGLLDKMDRRNESIKKGSGLGNWLDPVVEMGGKLYEQNPFTDEQGNIASEHVKGDAATTVYGTPWDSQPDQLGTDAVKRGDVPAGTDPHRAKDVQRIKFAPQVDHRSFPGHIKELIKDGPLEGRLREMGEFAGYAEHKTEEVGKLNSSRTGYRDSATEEMLARRM